MKRLTWLIGSLAMSSLLFGCNPEEDQNDTEIIQQRTSTRQQGTLDRVGINKPSSTQDKTVMPTNQQRSVINDQSYIASNTTPVGNARPNQPADKQLATNRYGSPVNQQGKLAGAAGMSHGVARGQTGGQGIQSLTGTHPELSTLNGLVKTAGLDGLLRQGEYTLLAPSNQAFAALTRAQFDRLKQDKDMLKQVLLFHIIQQPLSAKTLAGMNGAATLNGGKQLAFAKDADGRLHIRQAHIVTSDLRSGQGFVHVIDRVLMPDQLKNLPSG